MKKETPSPEQWLRGRRFSGGKSVSQSPKMMPMFFAVVTSW